MRAVGSTVPVAGEGTYRLRVPAYSVSGYGANRPDAFAQSYWLYADGTQKTSSLTTLSTSSVKSQSFNYSLSDPPSIGFQPRLGVSLYNSSTHVSFSVASPPYVEFEPTYPAAFAQPAETRPSTIIGNYGIIGDDGTISKSENQYIVNETNSTIYNPVTNTTVDMSGWSYDYSTRTYTITTDNSQTITVTYGDEYVTINEGDTIYNVYYIVDGSGGGGTTDPDTPSGGDDSTIGGMIESLISGLGSVVGGIIKGLLSLLTKALEALSGIGDLFVALAEQVTGIFGGFTAFLAAVFPFLPEEFFTVLTLGFVLLIAAAVIRKLLGK